MRIIKTINPMKSLSTVLSSIFLFTFRPNAPPAIPPTTMKIRVITWKSGTLLVTKEDRRLASWEKKITYREFSAATLVVIEKKKNKITRLIGPPPIPKKDERIPRKTPMHTQTTGLLIW